VANSDRRVADDNVAPPEIGLRPRFRLLLFALAAVSGWLDGVAFIVLGSVFVSVVTGNFVILGVAVSEQNWQLLGRVIVVVATNAAGVVAGSVIVRARGIEAWRAGPRPLLAAELVVLVGAALAWTLAGEPGGGSTPYLAYLAPITFAMGMQAALVSHLDVPNVQVNYVSGLFTSMASLFAARLTHRAAPRVGVPAWVFATIIASYVVAAMALGFLHTRGAVLLWTPVALVGFALIVTWHTDDD
jgi:uncharacterized membrane protein YoaK (UPF0700 family)